MARPTPEPEFGPTIGIMLIVGIMLVGGAYYYISHLKEGVTPGMHATTTQE